MEAKTEGKKEEADHVCNYTYQTETKREKIEHDLRKLVTDGPTYKKCLQNLTP